MPTDVSGTAPGQRHLNGIQTSGREFRNLSEPTFGVREIDDVPVTMRDGVDLLADVYRPDADAGITGWNGKCSQTTALLGWVCSVRLGAITAG